MAQFEFPDVLLTGNTAGYALAVSTGLLGGFGHCLGMCGPLIGTTVLDASRRSFWQKTLAQILYHIGRITTYSWLGALFGWAGSFVNVAGGMVGIQNGIGVIAGALMVLRGLEVMGILKLHLLAAIEARIGFVLRGVRVVQLVDSVWRYYLLGLLLGLLPCGLSYSAFLGAAGMGGPVSGFLFVFLFGLGTIPALILLGLFLGAISIRLRGRLYQAGGLSLLVLGFLFLYNSWASWR